MGNSNLEVGNQKPTRTSVEQPLIGAMAQQSVNVIGDNECVPQKLVRLVGCRDPSARVAHPIRPIDLARR